MEIFGFVSTDNDKQKWAYVYAPESNFTGMLENSLPTFWTLSLSKEYVDDKLTIELKKQPKRVRLWLNDGSCIKLRPEHKDHV